MPIAAPPPTRTPSRSAGRSPYDRGGKRTSGKSRDRGAKGPPKLPGGYNGRDTYRPNTPQSDPPLPPAPLLDLPSAGALAAAAALWGLLNPPKADQGQLTPLPEEIWQWGDAAVNMQARVRVTIYRPAAQTFLGPAGGCQKGAVLTANVDTFLLFGAVSFYLNKTGSNQCGWTGENWGINRADGTTFSRGSRIATGGAATQGGWSVTFERVSGTTAPFDNRPPRLVPFPRPPLPLFPEVAPPYLPEEPLPLTAPEGPPLPSQAPPLAPPAPAPSPPPAPAEPTQRPGPAPAFRPTAPSGPSPVPLPLLPPTTTTLPPPTQLPNQDGSMSPLPPAAGPVTPPGTEDFLGETIGQPEAAPPPTLQGIASEVGRIEQKLRVLSKQPQGGSADLDPLKELLDLLLEKLSQAYPAGSYEMVGPCEPALGGGPGASRSASWSGGIGSFASILARVDALAELLQHHKDLRQPICRQKASGEEVTVIFEEIG